MMMLTTRALAGRSKEDGCRNQPRYLLSLRIHTAYNVLEPARHKYASK